MGWYQNNMEKNRCKRNGTLEFWRFVFSIFVLLRHAERYVLGEPVLDKGVFFDFFPHGAIGVEFFFLLTGLFMARSVDKELQTHTTSGSLAEDTVHFVWKKYTSVFSYHIVVFLIIFPVMAAIRQYDWFHTLLLLMDSIPDILLIQMAGFAPSNLNAFEWYISTMIFALAVLYPLCKKHFEMFTKIIAPVASLLILGYLGKECGRLTGVLVWNGLYYRGMIRGVAEIMLGAFAYHLCKNYLAKLHGNISAAKRVGLTVLEWVCYTAVVFFVIMTFPNKYEFGALFFIFVSVVLSYSDLTYTGKLLNNPVSYFLGKFSLPIYLSQTCAIHITKELLYFLDESTRVMLIVVLTFVFAAITQVLGDILNTLMKKKKQQPAIS